MPLSADATRMIAELRAGKHPNVDFAQLYRIFSTEIDTVIDQVADFELKADNLLTYKKIKLLYYSSRKHLGDHCMKFGKTFEVLRINLDNFIDPRNSDNNQVFMDHAVSYLKGNAAGSKTPRVVVIAVSSTNIATVLLELLTELSDLLVALDRDPRYQKQKFKSILVGITGALCLVTGVIASFTPFFWVSPFMVTHGAKVMMVGGALAAAGAVATYKGFSTTLMDSSIKKSIEDYLTHKREMMALFQAPVLDHNLRATALQEFIESEIPGGITAVTLAEYIDSFDVLRSTFLNERAQETMIETMKIKVRRFLETRGPIIRAVTGVAAVTAVAAAVSIPLCNIGDIDR